ncbi:MULTISPECIES: hypothetical protein [Microbacterium]|nr:hypothetical protein [Microbacterium barkeri]MDI6943970.1 hypothetical protein [Microbacterium barkeri]MDR6877051.1 hypothetical protein [Microbacterium barkeri]
MKGDAMYNDDYGWMAGLGVGMMILGLVIYLGILALMLWVGYLIMRTAVKNGILRADEERAARGLAPRPGAPYPPQQGYAGPQHPGSPGSGPSYPGGTANPPSTPPRD